MEMFSHGNDLCIQEAASLTKKIMAIHQRKPQRKHLVAQKNTVCFNSPFIIFFLFLLNGRYMQTKESSGKNTVKNSNKEHCRERKVNYSTRKDARNVKNVSK